MIISEKKKAAQAIAEALGPVQTISVSKYVKVFHVKSKSQDIYVIPLRGHIQQYINSPAYKKWNARDPREIITNSNAIQRIPNDYAGPYISALKKYAKICTNCVIGTDADVEGCSIGMMDALPFVTQVNPSIKIMQIWLNDLQKNSIVQAYNNLIPPKWSWAYSGEARAILDAVIGFSATREVSLTLKPILNKINVRFTSIGRVQTSLLYLLYLRENLIRNFVSKPFWSISADLAIKDRLIVATHVKNNFSDKNLAESIYDKIKDAKDAYIMSIKKSSKKILPPTPLNTSKALVLITKNLKITAKLALKTLEDLYLNKIISYPRTDSDVFSKTYDHLSILQKFMIHNNYGSYVKTRFQQKKVIPRQGKIDAGDHSPITPLISLEPSSPKFENDLQKKVYNLVVRSYLALFGDPAEESDTKVLFSINEEEFVSRLSVLTDQGFYSIAPFLAKKYDAPLVFFDQLSTGKKTDQTDSTKKAPLGSLPVKKINLREKETQPPPRYNDTSLLKLMERKNLGTKSTRPSIIQILIDRTYIERKNRMIFVMELGFLLIDALKIIWLPFLDPKFTSNVEMQLETIRNGKKLMKDVVKDVKDEFLILFDKFRKEKPNFLSKMNVLEQTGNITRGRNNQIISNKKNPVPNKTSPNPSKKAKYSTALCPNCNKNPMKLVISRDYTKKFFVCESCNTFLSLPKKGTPKILKSKCLICGFDAVKIIRKGQNNSFEYYLCPKCWNQGLKDKTNEGFCSKCKEYSIENGKCIERKINP
ncbi:DNA topoisomerase [Promethearchaeum syntrophicum]|uniref:DNA topoisomerase n=1 Tax=Promethearchaeum syntrophicum TaxID=2594042 RepID=A0A5B9DD12_9ARCH|nr:DNA topoisomerase [Candidatus Prometheoarchaeum syntrophicum]QEE16660.1 Reverse gyrase 1 [Candidatus Prometheoarchaeum syntrophicum]